MIYRLEIENFFSIRDKQALDLTIAPNVSDPENRFAPIFPGSSLRAPKVVALYGANASGKTTILKAIDCIRSFITSNGSNGPTALTKMVYFNDLESLNRPISFAIEFAGVMNWYSPAEEFVYGTIRYEFEIEVKQGNATRVLREALRQRPDGKGRWHRVFERIAGENLKGSDHFKLSGYQHLENTLRQDVSVLASFGFFGHPVAKIYLAAAEAFSSNLEIIKSAPGDTSVISFLASAPDVLKHLNQDLSRIDVGIEEIKFDTSGALPVAAFTHRNLLQSMPWHLQSQGTQAFIKIFPLLNHALQTGGIALIDEFDALLHPVILPEVLRWFYDSKVRNVKNAQVWLSCHSQSLMESLVKEEIVITEKDAQGRSSIWSLMDMKDVRRDTNLATKYLSGVFGGVPVVG